MANDSTDGQRTTDHETIREWTEARGGRPARVEGTGDEDDPGLLRLDFGGESDENLEEISWEEFFEGFEENDLAMVYQEETAEGEESRFAKLVSRED